MPTADLNQFAEDLHQEVLAKAGLDTGKVADGAQLLREEMFTEVALEMLDEHDEVDGWDVCWYAGKSVGATPAAKLNAWALSGDGATLDLFVTLYHGSGVPVDVGKPELRRHFQLILGFLKRAFGGFHTKMEEASAAFHAAQQIHSARDTIATVRLFFLTDGVLRTMDIEQETLPDVEVRYVAWDLEKLSRLRVGERGIIELDLENNYGGGLPCLETSDGTGEYRTFLSFFPASLLARIYGEHGQRLLERNVRAFLQANNKVNKGIQATLRDEPHRFLAYNNGLCCTAADVRIVPQPNGPPLLCWIKDFQIVNGGQTTASIFHAKKKENIDVDPVVVQTKLTVLSDPAQIAEIVPMISRFANSQNKVNGADFSANGKFHRDLESMSRTVWAPAASGLERGSHWYYERARGSYLDDKGSQPPGSKQKEWATQNPPKQKFTKTDLAKYEHAWLGLPHFVCRGAEKNFEAFAARLEDDGEPPVDRAFFEQVVARAILWRSAERLFDEQGLQGYRANTVAYAVAWLAEHSGRRLDLDVIWRTQRLPESLTGPFTTLCREAHQFLTSCPGNVGEASKKPDTWTAFRDHAIDVDQKWKTMLREKPHVPYAPSKPNPKAQAAKASIGEIPAEAWFALSKWAKEHDLLEGWERSLSFSLGRLAANKRPPSDKQAVQAERIMARARELGFTFEK